MDLPPLPKAFLRSLHKSGEQAHIPYVWGAKPDLDAAARDIPGSDCSGWVRWLVYRATSGACTLPEGSAEQHEVARHILTPHDYADAAHDSGNLYIAFIIPTSAHPGHVWFVYDAQTMECRGGQGVSHRRALASPLAQEVGACFHWPGTP